MVFWNLGDSVTYLRSTLLNSLRRWNHIGDQMNGALIGLCSEMIVEGVVVFGAERLIVSGLDVSDENDWRFDDFVSKW
jgi:hypothetical protein